jgi:diguanylate cyclase (GGDEF)-like protein
MIGDSGTAARVGGDEFVILCEQLAALGSATEVGRRILARLEEPCAIDGHEVRVTASIGVALGAAADEAASLLSRADAAMYLAKQRGGSRHELYSPEIGAHAARRAMLRTDLRRAVDGDELALSR